MKIIKLILVVLLLFTSCQKSFDKDTWSEYNNVETKNNPRLDMVQDLMENHLEIGMSKEKVLFLLGEPATDTIGFILPRGVELPDSLKIDYDINKTKNQRSEELAKINKWYKSNYIQVPLMKYPIGWSLIDPIFLEIQINEKSEIEDFWTKEY